MNFILLKLNTGNYDKTLVTKFYFAYLLVIFEKINFLLNFLAD